MKAQADKAMCGYHKARLAVKSALAAREDKAKEKLLTQQIEDGPEIIACAIDTVEKILTTGEKSWQHGDLGASKKHIISDIKMVNHTITSMNAILKKWSVRSG